MSCTLIGTVVLSLLLIYAEKKINIGEALPYLLTAVAMIQIILYHKLQEPTFAKALFYFAFNGATSLVLLSLVSKRVLQGEAKDGNVLGAYTLINAGAIAGPLFTLVISSLLDDIALLPVSSFLLIATAFLTITLNVHPATPQHTLATSFHFPFKRLVVFMLLYTFVATGFYFFMLKTVTIHMESKNRIHLFTFLDLFTNSIVLVLPYLLRRWNQKSIAFLIVPCISVLLLSTLGIRFTVITAISALVIFKISNLSVQRPARELLYLQSSLSKPYSTRNFLDTTIYRLGDAMAAWTISLMTSSGFSVAHLLLLFLCAALLWIINGYSISKNSNLTTQ